MKRTIKPEYECYTDDISPEDMSFVTTAEEDNMIQMVTPEIIISHIEKLVVGSPITHSLPYSYRIGNMQILISVWPIFIGIRARAANSQWLSEAPITQTEFEEACNKYDYAWDITAFYRTKKGEYQMIIADTQMSIERLCEALKTSAM